MFIILFIHRSSEDSSLQGESSSLTLSQSNSDNQLAITEASNTAAENFGTVQPNSDQSLSTETGGSSNLNPQIHSNEIKKRSHAKQLIERYFYQLTVGCGNSQCRNENCASNSQIEALTPNQAAARAIKLFTGDVNFCSFISQKSTSGNSNQTESNSNPAIVQKRFFVDDRFYFNYFIKEK